MSKSVKSLLWNSLSHSRWINYMHHHRGEPNFYWHSTNMFLRDLEVWVSKLNYSTHSVCLCVCSHVGDCVWACLSQIKQTVHKTAEGHSNHNCAGGILEILTQQGSISLQVTENDIIKLLLTLQTIQPHRICIDNGILQNKQQAPGFAPNLKP